MAPACFKQEEEDDEEEPMQTCVGKEFVLYAGGAQGTDQLAEELGLHFGVQVEVLIPPGHSRSRTISPVSPRLLALANPHIEEAAEKLNKRVPTDFYILHLIQRNYELFGGLTPCTLLVYCKTTANESKGVQGGPCIGFGSRQESLSV